MNNFSQITRQTLILSLLLSTGAFAQAPRLINYQGLVVTSSGAPITDANHTFDFRIYNASAGGTQLWSEIGISVVTADGLFTRELGLTTPFNPNLFVNKDSSLYLEVTVDGQLQLPRTRLISVPFAETSGNLNGQSPYTGGTGFRTFPFGSRFSTYGDDGLEQIRLWGEVRGELLLFDSSPDNGLTALLTAGDGDGGKLRLGSDSAISSIFLDGGLTGDDAVQFPESSISSSEILNEPGVANGISPNFFTSLDSLAVDYKIDSVTITIPTNGYVDVTAGCYVQTDHVEGAGTDIFVGIAKTQNIDYFVPGCVVVGISNVRPTGNERIPAFSTRLFSEPAGTHTYFLVAERNSGGTSNTNIANPSIVARFFPTAYGSIATTSFDNDPDFPQLTGISPDGSQPFINPFIRIQTLEETNARLKAELEAAVKKLDQLRILNSSKIPDTQREMIRQNQKHSID